MLRMIYISSLFEPTPDIIHREIWHHTRDMDSIVSVTELARTGDGRKYAVVGTRR